jgi:hypothetical protein
LLLLLVLLLLLLQFPDDPVDLVAADRARWGRAAVVQRAADRILEVLVSRRRFDDGRQLFFRPDRRRGWRRARRYRRFRGPVHGHRRRTLFDLRLDPLDGAEQRYRTFRVATVAGRQGLVPVTRVANAPGQLAATRRRRGRSSFRRCRRARQVRRRPILLTAVPLFFPRRLLPLPDPVLWPVQRHVRR